MRKVSTPTRLPFATETLIEWKETKISRKSKKNLLRRRLLGRGATCAGQRLNGQLKLGAVDDAVIETTPAARYRTESKGRSMYINVFTN